MEEYKFVFHCSIPEKKKNTEITIQIHKVKWMENLLLKYNKDDNIHIRNEEATDMYFYIIKIQVKCTMY